MQIVSNITSALRRFGLFAVVLAILAGVARVEPDREQPQTKSAPAYAKVVKPKPVSTESSGWIKGAGWRRRG